MGEDFISIKGDLAVAVPIVDDYTGSRTHACSFAFNSTDIFFEFRPKQLSHHHCQRHGLQWHYQRRKAVFHRHLRAVSPATAARSCQWALLLSILRCVTCVPTECFCNTLSGTVRLGTTPLHFAVFSQQISFVKLILEKLCKSDMERLGT
jgi:hypothetical protein